MTEPATTEVAGLIDQAEVCRRLGISRTTLYVLRRGGHLAPVKIPGSSRKGLRWKPKDVDDFIENNRQQLPA
jgi:predicted DNA-binding transcriptional regulator AlpA